MDVRGCRSAALVHPQRQPLGEHVVGVGQPLPRLRVGAVAEAHAVLGEQLAAARRRRRRSAAADRSDSRTRPRPRTERKSPSARTSRAPRLRPAVEPQQQLARARFLGAPALDGRPRSRTRTRARRTSAAGRLREEDHPLGSPRGSRRSRGPWSPRAAARPLVRHRRPHAQVELAAELLDQALLVLGHLRIALREQHVALPGVMRSSFMRDYASRRRDAMPSTSTGPAPEPISRRPLATASDGDRRASRAASSGCRRGRGGRRAPRSACTPSRGRRRRVARALDPASRSPSKKRSAPSSGGRR